MKKVFLAFAAVLTVILPAPAQDRSIGFIDNSPWEEVLAEARRRDKVIFVDCYTDWCGPCKKVAREVFTLNGVADFFNSNFVNAKYEMEKHEDGQALAEKYSVGAFPTFLFIDPHTEELAYVKVGAADGHEWLIEAGEMALDPQMNMAGMAARYNSGDRSFELLKEYIALLGSLEMNDRQAELTEEYLASRIGEDMFTHETWVIITRSVMDPLSQYFPAIVRGREKYCVTESREDVDRYLTYAIRKASEDIVHPIWHPTAFHRLGDADTRHTELIETLKAVADYPAASVYLAFLETADLVRNGKWNAVLDMVAEVDKRGILEDRLEYDFYAYNLLPLGRDGGDEEQVARAVEMIRLKAENATDTRLASDYRSLANQVKFARQ